MSGSNAPATLGSLVPVPWRASLATAIGAPTFDSLADFLAAERARTDVYPPFDDTFAALRLTPPDGVLAVILGQDPYHRLGQAHGLAFSVPGGVKPPPSLRNILLELGQPGAGPSLEPWARRGVLLLNTVLTVEKGVAGSHRRRGWEPFTDEIIRVVDANPGPVVFLLWGRVAQAKVTLIDHQRHIVHRAAHPSPRSVKGFRGHAGFTETNAELERRGLPVIDWRL